MPNEYPFWLSQYGRTFKDTHYRMTRLNSQTSCIEYVISGKGFINTKNSSFIVEAGDTYMLHENEYQDYYSDTTNPMEKIWINFHGILARDIIKIYNINNVILFKNTDTYDMINNLHNICKSSEDPYFLQAETFAYFSKIIHFLASKHKQTQRLLSPIDEVRSYIDLHITDHIQIEKLAQIAHLTPEHTIRLFKKEYGATPHQYILDTKINLAKIMLNSSDKKIEYIAEQLGFSSSANFSAAFTKKIGVPPTAFRKNNKQ